MKPELLEAELRVRAKGLWFSTEGIFFQDAADAVARLIESNDPDRVSDELDQVRAQVRALRRELHRLRAGMQRLAAAPDLLVAKHGWSSLVEVKDGRGKVSDAQSDFAQAWHGDVYLIRGLEGIDMLLSEYEMAARDAR